MESLNDIFPGELDLDIPNEGVDDQEELKLEKILKRRNRRNKKKRYQKSKPEADEKMNVVKRVNHFVAIQVTNSQIRDQVKAVQEKMLSYPISPIVYKERKGKRNKKKKKLLVTKEEEEETEEHQTATADVFKDAMERIEALHFTVGVIGLYNQEEKERAKQAVGNCWEKFKPEIQKNPINLDIMGLDHFGNKVIFAKIQDEQHVTKLSSFANELREEFEKHCIIQAPQEFKAHMTIAKVSRSKSLFKKRIKTFPTEIWRDFEAHSFGQQAVESIQLLQMQTDPETKYYKILSEFRLDSNLTNSNDLIEENNETNCSSDDLNLTSNTETQSIELEIEKSN